MTTATTATAEVALPVPVDEAWAFLGDTSRVVALDPVLVAYEPETGTVEEGTLNRVTARVGPFRTVMTTRTEVLEPPHRAVFASVSPSRPVRVLTEDTLESTERGCRYTVTMTITPTVPVFGHLAAKLIGPMMIRGRRRFMERLHTSLAEGRGGPPGGGRGPAGGSTDGR
jgi:carbon monoxide dehydrogenase subunit G